MNSDSESCMEIWNIFGHASPYSAHGKHKKQVRLSKKEKKSAKRTFPTCDAFQATGSLTQNGEYDRNERNATAWKISNRWEMDGLNKVLTSLTLDSRSLWVSKHVQEYDHELDALTFSREHVGQSIPCVWRGIGKSWRAVKHWHDLNYLRGKAGKKIVEVTFTPDGRADATLEVRQGLGGCTEKVFALPHKRLIPFGDLLDQLEDVSVAHPAQGCHGEPVKNASHTGVPYYSAQDSSLLRDMPELLDDIDGSSLHFAERAFGSAASAVNVWIGDGRSLTTFHADPFENIYSVAVGKKIFELRPPCDAAVLPKPALRQVRWKPVPNGTNKNTSLERVAEGDLQPKTLHTGWALQTEEGRTEWIDEDEISENCGEAVLVTLEPGDILYLPALWFHRVRQSGITIAVNWWFEMTFGRDWIYREFCYKLRALHESLRVEDGQPRQSGTEVERDDSLRPGTES